ncbi:MAG: chitobiase/beta-hexosaminidase C-terminal domain-containing protein [Muribaculaceae bacterium]|nr:chitobiase/beta-hexosaminidase C-terminal domain-containing protein [Muribaculaceae bacterium]
MRKFFTLLTMCLMAVAAQAVDIVFDATVDVGTGSSTAGEFTIVKDGITIHVEQGVANGQHYRFYKNKKVTVTSEIGPMTTIVFDCLGENDGQYGPAGFTSVPDLYSYTGHLGTWTNGGATEVVFTATNFQVRATKVTVTVGGEVGLLAPNITPASGTYYEDVQVKMTCGTPDAKIYYTTDGTNPTTSSTLFNGAFTIPFELGKTVTVKAISAKDGDVSDVKTATYKFEDAPAFGWADMFNVADKTNVTFTYPSIVLWQSGSTLYCKDASGEKGYGIAYGSTNQVYQIGDIIPAGFGGQKTTYNGMPELQTLKGFQTATTYVEVNPDIITPAQVGEPYWAHYVLLKNVKVTINGNGGTFTDANGNSCTFFVNTFGVPAPEDGGNHDVWGIVAAYKPNNGDQVFQILPISFDKEPERIPPVDVASIEELYELNRGAWGHFTTPLTAIYQNGPNLYVIDGNENYSLVYGTVTDTFVNGDFINDAVASWTLYGGNKQITPNGATFVKAGHGDAIEPQIMAVEEIMTDMVHWYIGIENVTLVAPTEEGGHIMINDGTGEIILFDKFNIMEGVNINNVKYVEGFVSVYNDVLEFFPILVKGGYPKGDVNGDGEVNIADVNCLIDVILGARSADDFEGRADVNEDTEVNIADVNAVIDIILGK